MKNIALLLLCVNMFISCSSETNNLEIEKLSIEFNQNIATYSIVEKLVAHKEGRLFYIDGNSDDDHLPMVDLAFNQMSKYDNSIIIEQTLEYLNIVGLQQDLTYQGILRSNNFPQPGFKYSLNNMDVEEVKIKALMKYIQNLKSFYVEKKLSLFFKENAYFINGGIEEVKSHAPKGYLNKMENYYGEEMLDFKFYVNPFDVMPYEEEFWHGNGPKIVTKDGAIANMISSAYLPLEKESNIENYKEFGFNHPQTIKFLMTHEFGHSFVNHTLEAYTGDIKKYENLFYSGLIVKMNPQGYSNWKTCLIEHLVRLGEIRIAHINGEIEIADSLREMHINNFSFALIPHFEKVIVEYEQNRDKYPTFQDFVPTLISSLKSIDSKDIRKSFGLTNTTYKTTINLKVAKSIDEVFIVGNQHPLGSWDPSKIKMTKISDFVHSITLDLYKDVEFKFTKGQWENEAYIKGIGNNNIQLSLDEDKTYDYEVEKWK